MASVTEKTVLLLHGFPLNRSMWKPQISALEQAGWRVVAPNLPGFAGMPCVQHASMDSFADAAMQSLEAAGCQRAVVVGLSMGGYVAMRLLAKRPKLVQALVLADTRVTADSPEQVLGRLALADRVEREGVALWATENVPRLVAPNASERLRHSLLEMHLAASAVGTAAAARAMAARPDSRGLLAGLKLPTQIIVGAEDTLTPPAVSLEMHELIPGSLLSKLAGAGHMSNLEKPAAFNKVLLEFMAVL